MTAVTLQPHLRQDNDSRPSGSGALSWAALLIVTTASLFSAGVAARAEPLTLPDAEFTCLALNVYHEARNQPLEGQLAVAFVTLNRMDTAGRTICQTVYHGWAFSWTRDPRKQRPPTDQQAWSIAQGVARWALTDRDADPVGGSTFFHSVSVSPEWAPSMIRVRQIGDHVFYRDAASSRDDRLAEAPNERPTENP